MSLKNLIGSHANRVFLNPDHFAETVIRHLLGDTSGDRDQELPAIIDLPLSEGLQNMQAVQGGQILHRGTLTISEEVPVSLRDTWTARGELWSTITIGTADQGLRLIGVQMVKKETSSGRRGVM